MSKNSNEKTEMFVSETGKLCEVVGYKDGKNKITVVYNCIEEHSFLGLQFSFNERYVDTKKRW